MHANIAFIAFLATASASSHFPGHEFTKRSTCEAFQCPFHWNDTTLGVTQSCTPDVTNRGGSDPVKQPDEGCVDGPTTTYTVVSGDTLEKIAADYNSGVCDIAAANGLDNPDFIGLDQVLTIPTDVCTPDNDSCRTTEGTATCVDSSTGVSSTYAIQSGDTFFLIAADLGITLDSLVDANPDADAGNLQIGQLINIPICPTSTAPTTAPTGAPTSV